MTTAAIIVVLGVVALSIAIGAWLWLTFNQLRPFRNNCIHAFEKIKIAVALRDSLLPKWEALTARFLEHEYRTTVDSVPTRWNNVFLLIQQHPEVKGTAEYEKLMALHTSAENEIAFHCGIFNDLILEYNNKRSVLPTIVAASIIGFDVGKPTHVLPGEQPRHRAFKAKPFGEHWD